MHRPRTPGRRDPNGFADIAADFDDVDGYLGYRDHPEHRAIVAQYTTPIVARRFAVQYEL